VYSTAGDRRDEDIIEQGKLLGAAFDRVILYEDHYLRGRPSGQIIGLLRQGLAGATRTTSVVEIQGAVKSVETALQSLHPGELLLIQADEIDETVNCLRHYISVTPDCQEITLEQALATSPHRVPVAADA
jgi:cyanophycin synthetase